MEAAELARRLRLRPLPREGGVFRRTYADERSSAILYLLAAGDFSALHRLSGPELWHFHAGAPLDLLLLHPDGSGRRTVLHPLEQPQLVVPAGVWQGASSRGDWTLVGTTMTPPYRDEDVEFGDRAELCRGFPAYADRVRALTRGSAA